MSAAGLALVDAIHAAPKPRKSGTYCATLIVDGIEVDVTFDIDGAYMPATDTDPGEYPYAVLVTAHVGGIDITAWSERLGLDDLLDDMGAARFYDRRQAEADAALDASKEQL